MSETRSVVVRLSMEASGYIATAQRAGKASEDAMSKAKKAASEAAKAQDHLAGRAGAVALALGAGLTAAIAKTANFDQAMSNVQAATRETSAGMRDLREAALEAGAETAFSATEAAAGIENLAKAGLSTKDILDGGLTGALDLAAAGEMEVADAAEAAAGALAQFKLEGDQAAHVADLLAAGAGKAQGDVSDMVMALKQAGTVSAQTGLSLEETVGALSAMAEQSLLGSDAGTSFKTMLASLTPNSKKAADAMAAYNINAFDAQGNFVGMTELAGQLRDGLSGLTDEQRAMALETIFGSDAVRAAAIIYDNGAEGIAKWTAQVNDAGYAAETAETRLDNLKGDLEELGGALETALIGTGSGSQGFLRGLTQDLTGAINAYNGLPPSAQSAAASVIATGAAVGGSIWLGTKVIRGIADTRDALDNLGPSGDKASKAMKGVAIAGAALAGLAVAAEGIRAIQRATDEALPGMETLTSRLIDFSELGEGFSGSLGSEFDSLAESIDRMTDTDKLTGWSDAIGGLTGFDSGSLRRAEAEITALDEALAGMVSSGNAETAAAALDTIAEQYGLSESQVERLMTILPGYEEALAGQANDAELASAAQEDLAGATSGVGDAARDASMEVKDFGDVVDGLNERLAGRADMRDYEAAIDDFAAAIKENGNTFDITTEKGRENQAMLDNIAGTAIEVAKSMKGADRQRVLTAAIDDIRTMGKQMGLPKSEVRALIELLREANNADVKPKIDVDTSEFAQRMQYVRAQLDSIDRFIPVNIHVSRTGAGGDLPYLSGGARNQADGGVLDFYAAGGLREEHIAQIAPAGAWRVWAEPETGGEAYIPLSPAKRERSIDIWEEVGARLGVQFERFAKGGTTGKDGNKPKKPPKRTLEQEGEGLISGVQAAQWQAQTMNSLYGASLAQLDAAMQQAYAADAAALAAQDQLDAAEANTQAAEEGLRSAESIRDATQQLRDGIAESVSSKFTGQLTGGGLAGLTQTLDRDINAGSSMDAVLDALIAAGLDTTGPAAGLLAELAASEDLRTANELLAAGPEYIAEIERMYAERATVNEGRGAMVADAMYAEQLAGQNAAVAVAQQHVALAQASEAAAEARATALESHLGVMQDQLEAQRDATENLAGQLAEALDSLVRPGRN